jgi:hypothetical protein
MRSKKTRKEYTAGFALIAGVGGNASVVRANPTPPEGTSGAYLAPTACWPWGLSGTRTASEKWEAKEGEARGK